MSVPASASAAVSSTEVESPCEWICGVRVQVFQPSPSFSSPRVSSLAAGRDCSVGSGDREDHNVIMMAAADHGRPVRTGDGEGRVVVGVADAPLVAFLWSLHAKLANRLQTAYRQVGCLQRNLSMAPSGSTGKRFVNIITDFTKAFASDGPTACVAWECVAVAGYLLLQLLEPHSRRKENTEHLQQHIDMWAAGDLKSLLEEARRIQAHPPSCSGSAGPTGATLVCAVTRFGTCWRRCFWPSFQMLR